MKRILSIFLCLLMMTGMLTSCGAPKIEEISGRLSELIEASYSVNDLLFGEGPDTYERVYDPKANIKYYDAQGGQRYYYFYIDDAELGKILAYRTKSYGNDYTYLSIRRTATPGATAVYSDAEGYYYPIEYTYKDAEVYYDGFPEDYDIIRFDEEIKSVEQIKELAEKVYSKSYLDSMYETLFTGIMASDDEEVGLQKARYIEYEDDNGKIWFMKSNTYKALVTEKRIFDLSTAKIARGSNSKRVRVQMESYLESKPDERLTVIVNLALQDGVWYLDNGTY